jgi:hypothetical protein
MVPAQFLRMAVCVPAKSFPANESGRQLPSVSNFPAPVENMGVFKNLHPDIWQNSPG